MHRKIWLITAASLVLVGCLLFAGVMTVLNWDFSMLATVKYVTNEYAITKDFKNISIIADTADIFFMPTQDAAVSVVCYEQENARHTVSVQDGTLTVELVKAGKWHEYIGIVFDSPKITVRMPQGAYETLQIRSSTGDVQIPAEFSFMSLDVALSTGDVTSFASVAGAAKITTATGGIRMENLSADTVELAVSTGKMSLSNVKCTNFTSVGATGDITLKSLLCTGKMAIVRDTGDVRLEDCDAAQIHIQTATGDVVGSLLTPKVFAAETDTGGVKVPASAEGGPCVVKTDTGDIRLTLAQYDADSIIR